jgi:hypothetical protein
LRTIYRARLRFGGDRHRFAAVGLHAGVVDGGFRRLEVGIIVRVGMSPRFRCRLRRVPLRLARWWREFAQSTARA